MSVGTIGWLRGLAIASGVPALVLVSIGPTAALAGPSSILAWALSSVGGFLMAIVFSRLIESHPRQPGGIAPLAASVLAPRSRLLAITCQWSYWFGWSPALAINGAVSGTYLRAIFWPHSPPGLALALGCLVLLLSAAVNSYGIRLTAGIQTVVGTLILAPFLLLMAVPWLSGTGTVARLESLQPPSGWNSLPGVEAFLGALFLAGWSTYGSEISLTYASDYRHGGSDAKKALLVTAAISVVIYTLVPFMLVSALSAGALQTDPSTALLPLARSVTGQAAPLVMSILLMTLVMSLNVVTIASSRVLYQMAQTGYAWGWLGRLNSRGVPANAVGFDLVVNVCLLIGVTAAAGWTTFGVQTTLLAAANVGYFLSLILALLSAAMARRQPHQSTITRPIIWLSLVLAAANCVLLAAAPAAWGVEVTLLAVSVLLIAIGLYQYLPRLMERPRAAARDLASRPHQRKLERLHKRSGLRLRSHFEEDLRVSLVKAELEEGTALLFACHEVSDPSGDLHLEGDSEPALYLDPPQHVTGQVAEFGIPESLPTKIERAGDDGGLRAPRY